MVSEKQKPVWPDWSYLLKALLTYFHTQVGQTFGNILGYFEKCLFTYK